MATNSVSEDSALGSDYMEDVCNECQRKRSSRHRERSTLVDSKDAPHVRRQSRTVTEWDIHKIAPRLGEDWLKLARQLKFNNEQIANFRNKENLVECAIAMLNAYIRKEGRAATIRQLVIALTDEKVGRTDIAEQLQGEDEFEEQQELHELGRFCINNVKYAFYLKEIRSTGQFNPEKNTVSNVNFPKEESQADESEDDSLDMKLLESQLKQLESQLKQYEEDHIQEMHRLRSTSETEGANKCEMLFQKLQDCFSQLKGKDALHGPGDNFGVRAEAYDECIKLAEHGRKLQDMIEEHKKQAEEKKKELSEATQQLETILNHCKCFGENVEKYENLYQSLLYQDTQIQRTQSEPIKKRLHATGNMRPYSAIQPETMASAQPSPRYNKPEENKEVSTPTLP